jgi:hypothetical protein
LTKYITNVQTQSAIKEKTNVVTHHPYCKTLKYGKQKKLTSVDVMLTKCLVGGSGNPNNQNLKTSSLCKIFPVQLRSSSKLLVQDIPSETEEQQQAPGARHSQ